MRKDLLNHLLRLHHNSLLGAYIFFLDISIGATRHDVKPFYLAGYMPYCLNSGMVLCHDNFLQLSS